MRVYAPAGITTLGVDADHDALRPEPFGTVGYQLRRIYHGGIHANLVGAGA